MNSPSTPLRILVVDDHADTARMLTKLLKGDGHDAVAATDYLSALDAARTARFDLMLCDVGLGDRDGCDLLAEVRALYPLKAVALTGYGLPDEVRRIENSGFDQHVLKPVDLNTLLQVIGGLARPAVSGGDAAPGLIAAH